MRGLFILVILAWFLGLTPAKADGSASFQEVEHHVIRIEGIRLHYVTAGAGEPVLLIPGWPESWIAWRKVIPVLTSAGRQVYVLDPKGFGDSDKPPTGYDLDSAADELHQFIKASGLYRKGGIDIVGHDVGSWIAHAHAAKYPSDVKRLVLTEAALPGISSPATSAVPSETANLKTWHFAFNRLDDLPEILVQGHERAYLTWLFTTKTTRIYQIEPVALDEYVRVFSEPGAARAGFAWYRAAFNSAGLKQAQLRAERRLPMPVLALGGSDGVGDTLHATVTKLGDRVQGGVIVGCRHFLPEECPRELADSIEEFWRYYSP